MRIAHVITRLISGGADENTIITCNGQAELGHEVHLIVGAVAQKPMLEALSDKVIVHQAPSLVQPLSPLNDVMALGQVFRVLRSIRPNLVHTHTSKAGIIGRFASVLARVPLVIHGVHILPFLNVAPAHRALYLAAERFAGRYTDAFIHVSEGMWREAVRQGLGPSAIHEVVPSGMDIERFIHADAVSDGELGRELGQPHDAAGKRLVMVSALEPRKRVVEFLDAFRAVVDAVPGAQLLVFGEGPERQRIERRIEALGLSGRVVLMGFRSDVERWLASAQVCVLASEREGLPRAVVQYALAGKPIVTTRLAGIEAIVRDGWNGRLVEAGDLGAMARHLVQLLGDEQELGRMSHNSRSLDLSPWSDAAMVAQIESIYVRTTALKAKAQGRLKLAESV